MACLDETTVLAWVDGQLSAIELQSAQLHVDTCAECRTLVGEIARTRKTSISPGDELEAQCLVVEQRERYTLGEVLGQGAQARVLLAYDAVAGREVAFKQLLAEVDQGVSFDAGSDISASRAMRFLREARISGQLEHPNIVPVYEIGKRADGTLYYTMQRVRGHTLAQAIERCRSARDRLGLLSHFLALCHAIAFAHSRGVVHRDVKPQNVMVGEFGETVVLDWGLSVVKADVGGEILQSLNVELAATTATVEGTLIGTPAYMSPEQAEGRVGEIDERSDIFGLGAVLYEILTGQPPYGGETWVDVMRAAREASVPSVRALCPEASSELVAIAEKALAGNPDARYQRAGDIAQEIERFLTGQRVHAHAYSSWELAKRFAAQNRAAVIAAGITTFVVLAALVSITSAYQAQSRARAREHTQQQIVEAQRKEAVHHAAQALVESSRAALAQGDPLESAAKLRSAMEVDDSVTARALWWQQRLHPMVWARSFDAAVYDVAFSPDGRSIAAGSGTGMITLLNATTREVTAAQQIGGIVWHLVFVSSTNELAANVDGGVLLVDVARGSRRVLVSSDALTLTLAAAHDGRRLAVGSRTGSLCVYDIAAEVAVSCLPSQGQPVTALSFGPDDRWLTSGSQDGFLRQWDLATGTLRATVRQTTAVSALATNPLGDLIASGGDNGSLRLVEMPSGHVRVTVQAHTGKIQSLAFAAEGTRLASGGADGALRLWDGSSLRSVSELARQLSAIRGLDISPAGTRIVSGSFDSAVRLWDLRARQPGEVMARFGAPSSVSFSIDGRLVAGAYDDGTVKLWNVATGALVRVLRGHDSDVRVVRFSPDGTLLASASRDRTVRLWDFASGSERAVLVSGHGKASALAFSADGTLLASADSDGAITLWNVREASAVRSLVGHTQPAYGLAFAGNDRSLLSASFDQTIRSWDVRSGSVQHLDAGDVGPVGGLAMDRAGRYFVSGDDQGVVLLWDTKIGTRRTVVQLPGAIDQLARDPSRSRIAVSVHGPKAFIYDIESDVLIPLTGHRERVPGISFSPDGRLVGTASDDGSLRLWEAETGQPFWRGVALVGSPPRSLTHVGWTVLDGSQDVSAPAMWQTALAQRARFAAQDETGVVLCAQMLDGSVEMWNTAIDELIHRETLRDVTSLAATPSGCVVMAAGEVVFIDTMHLPTSLAHNASAIAATADTILVATDTEILRFDADGRAIETWRSAAGISALAALDDFVAVGHADGRIEVRSAVDARAGDVGFLDVPASAVVTMTSGPAGTLAAGFANGAVGLWSTDTGVRLAQAWLHGPVVRLLYERDRFYALDELGMWLTWDLHVFDEEYCQLLHEVWRDVPTAWENRPVIRAPPRWHSCIKDIAESSR